MLKPGDKLIFKFRNNVFCTFDRFELDLNTERKKNSIKYQTMLDFKTLKKGDKVIAIDVEHTFGLKLNTSYTISAILDRTLLNKHEFFVVLDECENGVIYFTDRFELDIKSIRKNKLENLWQK